MLVSGRVGSCGTLIPPKKTIAEQTTFRGELVTGRCSSIKWIHWLVQKNTPTFAADSPHISERTALSPTLRNLCNELPLKTILARKISIKNQHPLWDELSKYHLFNGFPHVSPFFSLEFLTLFRSFRGNSGIPWLWHVNLVGMLRFLHGGFWKLPPPKEKLRTSSTQLPWEPTTFIFRGYNPYLVGVKPSFFMVLGSKGKRWWKIWPLTTRKSRSVKFYKKKQLWVDLGLWVVKTFDCQVPTFEMLWLQEMLSFSIS